MPAPDPAAGGRGDDLAAHGAGPGDDGPVDGWVGRLRAAIFDHEFVEPDTGGSMPEELVSFRRW